MKRKYLSEFAVNLCSAGWLLIPASQVASDGKMAQEEAELSKNCHIYLICERPAIFFDANDFSYENGKIAGSIVYKINGVSHRERFEREFPLLDDAIELRLSKYPHREIQTFNQAGDIVRYLPANALSVAHDPFATDHPFRQLKVLYVGQAFGGGNRAAIDRLRSHSTLQKILAELSYNSPDSEVFVLTVEYAPYRIIASFDGRASEAIADGRDAARYISVAENPLKLGEQISLAEAALIRYFQPQYNTIYKKKFPSTELKVLKRCYDYDFSGLVVEINTDELHFSLFSDVVRPSMHHIANIDLVDHEARVSFFHFQTADGVYRPMPGVIGSAQNAAD